MLEQKEIALRLLDWVYKGYANPFKLDILLTNLCNLKCIFCWQRNPIYKDTKDSHLYELSDATLIRLIEEGIKLGVKKWEFSGGGEPFMRKDLLFKLLTIIKNNGCEVCIITNGTLLSYKDILKLLDLHCDEIIISLDGPNEKVNDLLRPPKGSFKKIINTLNNFKKIKDKKNEKNIKIKINCVISKLNINNITDMVKLAAEYNLNGITFDLLQDLSPTCNGFFIDLIQDHEILTSQIVKAVKIANEYNLETNLNGFLYQNRKEENNQLICHSDYDNTSKTESILNFYCFEPWYRIFIHVAGNVSPCCIVSSFEDNIKNKTLKEVWMSKNFIDFRNRISSLDLLISCKKCAQSFRIHTETH